MTNLKVNIFIQAVLKLIILREARSLIFKIKVYFMIINLAVLK